MFKAEVRVTLKSGVLDPQGKAVAGALSSLGYTEVDSVRVGKLIEINLPGDDRAAAEKQLDEMCRRLLANPVIETYTVSLTQVAKVTAPILPPGVAF